MQAFIDAYRSQLPYDATGANHAKRLTPISVLVTAGRRYLQKQLLIGSPLPIQLIMQCAMVPARQPSASGAIGNWQNI